MGLKKRIVTVPAAGSFDKLSVQGCGVIVAQAGVFELYSEYPTFHFNDQEAEAFEIYPESKYGMPFSNLYVQGTSESEGSTVVLYIIDEPIQTDLNPIISNIRETNKEFTNGVTFQESISNAAVFSFSDAQKYKGGAAGTGKAASVLISPENESLRYAFGVDPVEATPLGHILTETDSPLVIEGWNFIEAFRALSISATASDVTFTMEFPVNL